MTDVWADFRIPPSSPPPTGARAQAPISFDDLIPQRSAAPANLSFDDLIPNKPADEWAEFRVKQPANVEAELFDGTVLEFPAGTDPAVIQRVAKEQTAQRRATASAAPTQPWQGGVPVGGVGSTEPATKPKAEPPPAPTGPTSVYRGMLIPREKMSDGSSRWAVPGIVSDTIDALRLPEKVATGEIDPMSDEGFRDALGLAGLVTGTRMPGAGKVLANAAGDTVPAAVGSALKADGIPLGEVASRVQELGPAGVVADLGPNSRYKAAALATRPGAAQTTVVDAMRARQIAAPDRLTGALDETLGPAPVPSYVDKGLKGDMKELGPQYDTALAGASPVDTKSVADAMDADIGKLRGEAQTRLQSVRGMLNEVPDPANPPAPGAGPTLDTNPATLHQTRQAIDGMLQGEQDGNVKRVLSQVRTELDAILGGAVPDIKRIDAQYSELGRQRSAVKRGQTVLDNGREAPRPAELRDEVAAGAVPSGDVVGPSGVAFRLSQGARAEIDRLVGTKLNDRAALNSVLKGESDWNYDRLSTLFGKEKVDQLYRVLDNERAMAETENMALSNSKTAGVQAAQKEINGPQTTEKGPFRSALNFDFGDTLSSMVNWATGGLGEYRRNGINEEIAQALMGRGDLTPTTRTDTSKTNTALGTLIDTIMQSAVPTPAQKPIYDEEFMRALMRNQAT